MKGYAICPSCNGVMIVEKKDSEWEGVHCNSPQRVQTGAIIMESIGKDMNDRELKEALDWLGD